MDSPEDKTPLDMTFEPDEKAIDERKRIEGIYVLQTSLDSKKYPARKVDEHYRSRMKIERAFGHIKPYLRIRPVYHRTKERVRAHVLICFMAYYLVKKMELEMRGKGETREVERVLKHWDGLCLCQFSLEIEQHSRQQWQSSLDEHGQSIQQQIKKIGWWRSLASQKQWLIQRLMEQPIDPRPVPPAGVSYPPKGDEVGLGTMEGPAPLRVCCY